MLEFILSNGFLYHPSGVCLHFDFTSICLFIRMESKSCMDFKWLGKISWIHFPRLPSNQFKSIRYTKREFNEWKIDFWKISNFQSICSLSFGLKNENVGGTKSFAIENQKMYTSILFSWAWIKMVKRTTTKNTIPNKLFRWVWVCVCVSVR